MNYEERIRTYQLHIPPLRDERGHHPLVIVLHGGGGKGQNMKQYLTRGEFDALADEEGFVVIYPDGVEVALYTIEGGGHTWPGGYQYLPEWIIGKTSLELNASEGIWRFFETKKRTE